MTNDSNNLDWLAFSYAAGELENTDREQFEARLADDQTAREALARAVELCQTVSAAEEGVVVFCAAKHGSSTATQVSLAAHTHQSWNQRLSWMAVGGLASLLLAVLWTGVIGPAWQTANRNFRSFSQRNLASAWTETRTEIANVREAGYWPTLSTTDADDDVPGSSSLDENLLEDAPSWMTAAVFSLPMNNSATDPAPNQRLEN